MVRHKTALMIQSAMTLLVMVAPAPAAQTDNAALLYYQACLLYEKPDETMTNILTDFCKGRIPSNQAIRDHVEKNRRVIDYAVRAASLTDCDWAYDYSQGFDLALPNLPTMKRVTILVVADARLLAEQGDYQTAIDRCLTTHRMALHVMDRTLVTYLMGISMGAWANLTLQDLLPHIAGDASVLNGLKAQLGQFQNACPSVATAVTQESQVWAASMRKEQVEPFLRMLKEGGDPAKCETAAAMIRRADDGFFERSRTHWFNSITAVTGVLKSGLPYPETYARLSELDARLAGEGPDKPEAILTALSLPATQRVYVLATRLQTHFNALRVAIDLYMAKARTGRLPDALPAGAPLDPFSGQPFEYEKAGDRFVLRCRAKESPEKAEANQYEFNIG